MKKLNVIPHVAQFKEKPDPVLSNIVQHWGFFSQAEIDHAAQDCSLLMLDLDFGRGCSLNCPGCFRRANIVDAGKFPDLTYEELMGVIDEARGLGLESVKVCGVGEPFENPKLLDFATDLTEKEIGLAIFTKGHILGDDKAATKIFGPHIKSGQALAKKLFELKTSILLNFPSFNSALVSKLVGDASGDYPQKLRRAAEVLAKAGFNKTLSARMAFIHAPITKQSIAGAFKAYQFARERNILPVLAFHMVSGQQIDRSFLIY